MSLWASYLSTVVTVVDRLVLATLLPTPTYRHVALPSPSCAVVAAVELTGVGPGNARHLMAIRKFMVTVHTVHVECASVNSE